MTDPADRARAEVESYEQGDVRARSETWHRRARHVLQSPNTNRGEELWREFVREAVRSGGRALDVGCGDGETSRLALDCGASYVLGVDISARQLERALPTSVPGRLEFRVADAQLPIADGPFDLVLGRSVLHHMDFREFLVRVAASNLAPEGRMLWMEPLAHPLALAFHKLVRSAHTPGEFPLLPRDLRWIERRFPGTRVHPINLLSFPAGVISTWLFESPDNRLMRLADSADTRLLRAPWLAPFARQGVIAIPASGESASDHEP